MTPDFTRFPVLAAMILWLAPALLWYPAIAGAEPGQMIQLRDGDSFVLNGEEIRLWGIDAPEFFQECRRQDGENYPCGKQAKAAFVHLIDGRSIRCEPMPRSKKEDRTVARCFAGEDDLGREMVAAGWAVEYKYFSKGFYADAERAAKTERSGIWNGTFDIPRDWR